MLEIQHLKKQYDSVTPLEDVNATINKGDAIAVIGPSGTGKSTLLRCINMLEKPTSGCILLNGEDITAPKCDLNKVRTSMGMVFQSFNLYDHLTVVENCMLAQRVLLKRSRQQSYNKAMELLDSVGMTKFALQYPSLLSGGQKQRAAIARTLSTDPEIILFDEPTSALDPLTVGEVESVIEDISRQGRTMMIVTHSMDFARKVSNRVFYMDKGGIYEDGTPEEIFDNPIKERTRKFVRRLASLDMVISDGNHNLDTEIGKIYSFCSDKNISSERILNACGAYEEYINMLYKYAFDDIKTVHISIEYDEPTDKLSISFSPYSLKEWSKIEEIIFDSLEYRLFSHYVNGVTRKKEQSDDISGIRYTYYI